MAFEPSHRATITMDDFTTEGGLQFQENLVWSLEGSTKLNVFKIIPTSGDTQYVEKSTIFRLNQSLGDPEHTFLGLFAKNRAISKDGQLVDMARTRDVNEEEFLDNQTRKLYKFLDQNGRLRLHVTQLNFI
jgi:hypothetical protein